MSHTKKHKHTFGFLGHIFCSGDHNDHQPHILRGVVLIAITLLGVFLLGMSFARYYFLHQTVLGQQVLSSVLIDLTNETRVAYGESPLVRNHKLEDAARMKAEDMATYQYFAHNSPTGVTPWHWVKKAGYDFLYAGENLAIDFVQSKDVKDAWMESPTHRANILNSKFQEIGISTKEGVINGHNTIYVVQTFGTPKSGKVAGVVQESSVVPAPESTQDTTSATGETEVEMIPDGEVAGAVVESQNKTEEQSVSEDVSPQRHMVSQEEERSQDITVPEREIPREEYVTLLEGNNTIIVADREAFESGLEAYDTEEFESVGERVQYAGFWQKLVYNFWYDLNVIYKVIMGAIMVAIVFLFFVEFRRHHWLHMAYGFITIIIMLLLLYINQSLW